MGGRRFSTGDRRDDESAAFFNWAPAHSAGSSPLPLLAGNAAKATTTRRHVAVVRFICAPFTAVFRMKCARGSTRDDDKLCNDDKAAKTERGEGRRPSLEELLRMDESLSRREHKTTQEDTVAGCRKEHAVVVFGVADSAHRISCTVKEEPSSPSKSRHGVVTSGERETAIVPVKVDVDITMSPGGSTTLSPAVPLSSSLRRALLQALRMDMGLSKGQYCKLAGRSGAAGAKAELFYQRPIPMGRRCRVQHLEESPYM